MSSSKHFMVCISGFSGSGKDEFARTMVEELGAPKVGLADPAKRHMADLYGFTEQQLFGPSAARNAGDVRYPKRAFFESGLCISSVGAENVPEGLQWPRGASPEICRLIPGVKYWEMQDRRAAPSTLKAIAGSPFVPGQLGDATVYVQEGDPHFWLSPRESLQLYCELMNTMYGDTWIRKSVSVHMQLGRTVEVRGHRFMQYAYDRMSGLVVPDAANLVPAPEDGGAFFSCSADFRHRHEFNLVRKIRSDSFVPVTVRVRRPSVPDPPFDHRSETEQATIPDGFFDFVVDNDGTVEDLHDKARRVLDAVQTPGWQPVRGTL